MLAIAAASFAIGGGGALLLLRQLRVSASAPAR
jgi:hypothetical protein